MGKQIKLLTKLYTYLLPLQYTKTHCFCSVCIHGGHAVLCPLLDCRDHTVPREAWPSLVLVYRSTASLGKDGQQHLTE